MRKSFIKKIASMVMMTTMAISFVYPTYANTNVPTNVSITGDNLFDGTAGISISIPDSMPLTVNEGTGNYEFEDFVSASGAVYHDQNLTVAIPNGTVQYMTNNDESTALTGTVGFCNDSGEFVKFSEGKSYEGLPDFPLGNVDIYGDGKRYWKEYNYILLHNSQTDVYYLVKTYEGTTGVYCVNNKLYYQGIKWYRDSSCTSSYETFANTGVDVYSCSKNDTSWTFVESVSNVGSNGLNMNLYGDTLVQCSEPIYTDSTCTEIYFKGCKNPYAATNGTYVEISADDIVENYKEIQSGTESFNVTNKKKMKIIVNPGDINYLGNYVGTVIFETTLSEHVETP